MTEGEGIARLERVGGVGGGVVSAQGRPVAVALATALVMVIASGLGAQEAHDPVGDLLDMHRTTGQLSDGLDGSAGAMLAVELERAHAFLVGELHLTREIPELTRVIARAAGERGYGRLAVEVGPVTAQALAEAADNGVEGIAGLVRRYPFAFPFFDRRGDAELLVDVVGAGYSVLGLDQEFTGSPRILLDRLEPLAGSDAEREAVREWRQRELAALQRFLQTQDMSGAVMISATPEEFAALRDHFADPAAQRIVDEMAESAAIYQEFRRGENYRSNHHRIVWMKEHLRRYREAADDRSKLLMKFGSVHMGRGYSDLTQLDLGNHVAELAAAAGGNSFHLYTVAGRVRGLDGEVSEIVGPDSYLRPFLDRAAEQGWTLFDLRPLRPWFHRDANREADPELAELVFRYDALAMRQEVNEAEELR